MNEQPERTIAEVIESTAYGNLYVVKRLCGRRILCHRVRRRGEALFETDERITIERRPESKLEPAPGDFAFLDHYSKTWSLWKVKRTWHSVDKKEGEK